MSSFTDSFELKSSSLNQNIVKKSTRSDNSSLSSSVPPLKCQNKELYNSKPEISVSLSSSVSKVIDYTVFQTVLQTHLLQIIEFKQ